MLPAVINNHSRTFAEISPRHLAFTFRATPVDDLLSNGVATLSPWLWHLVATRFDITSSIDGFVDQDIEVFLRHPQTVAIRTLIDTDTANTVGWHLATAGRASDLMALSIDLMWAKFDATASTKTGVLGVTSETLRTDQAQLALVANNWRLAIVTALSFLVDTSATGTATHDLGNDALIMAVLDAITAVALKGCRSDIRSVELGVTIWAGDEIQDFNTPGMK